MAKNYRSDHRASEVARSDEADLRGGKVHHIGPLQHRADRAHQCYLESVKYPGDAEADHEQGMEGTPRQTIQPRWYQGLEGFGVFLSRGNHRQKRSNSCTADRSPTLRRFIDELRPDESVQEDGKFYMVPIERSSSPP